MSKLASIIPVVPVLLGLGCGVDVPDPHEGSFACDDNVDCIEGYACISKVCTPACTGEDCTLLGTRERPASSCRQLRDLGRTASAPYWIEADGPRELYCDMTTDGGGWTLVGEVHGQFDMYSSWLRSAARPENLRTPAIETGAYACVNAVPLAVGGASQIRLSDGGAVRWVRWDLPAGRTVSTWWNHAAGQQAIANAFDTSVDVVVHDGRRFVCMQNTTGILPFSEHGGSYPCTSQNSDGNTMQSDWCMAVGVMRSGVAANGFDQNGNGFDAPQAATDWPNGQLGGPPSLQVWLR